MQMYGKRGEDMSDLIKRSDAIEAIEATDWYHINRRWTHLWDAPDGTYKGRCNRCGLVKFFIEGHDAQYNFCPQCGADMRGDSNE